jgi:hypothetical protein
MIDTSKPNFLVKTEGFFSDYEFFYEEHDGNASIIRISMKQSQGVWLTRNIYDGYEFAEISFYGSGEMMDFVKFCKEVISKYEDFKKKPNMPL